MKAISPLPLSAEFIGAALALVLLGSCAGPPPPVAAPPVRPAPTVRPQPAPQPLAPASNWRDAPITPGDWQWGTIGGTSTARFASGALELRCDRASGSVLLIRPGSASGPVPVTVSTTSTRRTVTAQPFAGPPAQMVVTLAAHDDLLDAMAFSRGRFAVEVAGLPPIYAPSWPEVSRVIEDCR